MGAVEEFGVAEAGPAGPQTTAPDGGPHLAPRPRRPRRSPRRLAAHPAWWVAVAGGLVIAGVVAAPPAPPQTVDNGGGIPWNIIDVELTDPPAVAWSIALPVRDLVGAIDGSVVVALAGTAGRTLAAVDLSSGYLWWQVEDPGATCRLGAHLLVCTHDRGERDARLVTWDATGATGEVTPYPYALAAVDLEGGDLLVVEGGSSAPAQLVRVKQDLTQRWRVELGFPGSADDSFTRLTLAGTYVGTSSGSFNTRTGRPAPASGFPEVAVDGSLRTSPQEGWTSVEHPDGSEATVASTDAWLRVDDAFGGPVSIMSTEGGVAVHVRGEEEPAWRMDADGCWLVGRVQGVLLRRCFDAIGATTEAYDELTGELLWRRSEAGGWLSDQIASADTLLLTIGGGVSGIDPRTGDPRWTRPVTGTFADVDAIGDALLVWSDRVLMRLG